ncbi:uncharacterized protein LOC124293253 [Neodiprion lecontei]|uniref:Uncharacterized protein LOC124293253 n=1 Tax=Neodiprion lecontei TaxID=441921 RepID=A0ABM3FN62_NEOLC|nr:uncharacterized protein LOC124293253 [Neodiprion lecontei]
MHIPTGPSSHEWARQADELRISKAEEQAARDSKEERVLRRQMQKDALDHLDGSLLLYGPGIDDSVGFTLREEIRKRTQGENEPVADYLTYMRAYFDRLSPGFSHDEEMDYAYRNLLPRFQVLIRRRDLEDLDDLEDTARQLEMSFAATLNDKQTVELRNLLKTEVAPASDKIGTTNLATQHIDVGDQPAIGQRAYRVSPKIQEAIDEEVDKMLAYGIIEPSHSEWAGPIIPSTQASREVTAFIVPGEGLFHLTRMPYGLTGAPATFQRLLDRLIGPDMDPYALAYLDDIIIATKTFDEHLEWLRRVLRTIRHANLTVNPDKCEFCCSEVKYLGFIVNEYGLQIDPAKIAPVVNYPVPHTVKQLRRFLGMASWYRRFIPNLASITEPLTRLLRKT